MRSLVGLLCLMPLGCGEGGHGGVPGDELGTYTVVGDLTDSTCGQGALGALDPWTFDVKLSRADRELFWLNGREAIAGVIERDGVSFSFETRVEAEVSPAERGRKACVVSRSDSALGELSAAGNDVRAFTSTLTFAYSALEGSDCSGLIGVEGGFTSLPCALDYSLEGTRTSAPEAQK